MQQKSTKEKEFERIYQLYKNDVYKISLYYTRDEYIAEDVTQKVFFKFYLHSNNVNPDCIKSYLLRAARNLSYNWIRDTKRETDGEYLDNVPEENLPLYSAEDEYFKEQKQQSAEEFLIYVLEALREENESWYEILNLICCLEKSHDEAAEELGISKEVLYSKYYRAKRWIRKKFEKEYLDL